MHTHKLAKQQIEFSTAPDFDRWIFILVAHTLLNAIDCDCVFICWVCVYVCVCVLVGIRVNGCCECVSLESFGVFLHTLTHCDVPFIFTYADARVIYAPSLGSVLSALRAHNNFRTLFFRCLSVYVWMVGRPYIYMLVSCICA